MKRDECRVPGPVARGSMSRRTGFGSWQNGYLAVVLQNSAMHLFRTGAPDGPERRVQLMVRQMRSLHDVREELSVVNQDLRTPFNQGFQLLAFVGGVSHQVIERHEG